MNIQYENYTFEPEGRTFNLFKTVKAKNAKTKKEYDKKNVLGWGMRFETCIETVITDKLADRQESLTLRQFVDEYKGIKEEIGKILS